MWLLFPLIFLSGFVDSIAGGGGIISLSSYLAAGLPAHLALGTNKFSAVIGTGIATARFARRGHVRWDAAAVSFLGALAGSALGANLALFVPERALVYILLLVLPAIAALVLRGKGFTPRSVVLPPRARALVLICPLIRSKGAALPPVRTMPIPSSSCSRSQREANLPSSQSFVSQKATGLTATNRP